MASDPFFILSNDDGIDAPGLHAAYDALIEIGDVAVVAPATEMSAVGHAITLSDPLRVWSYQRRGEFFGYAVKGTPADCIKIGYWALLKRKPDAVISGINLGGNTGINTIYSGTVSAATEGAILGVPSFAISLATYENPDYTYAAKFVRKLTLELLEHGLPEGVFLNVNIPPCREDEIRGVSVTRQGRALYKESFDRRVDPHGHVYYWLTGQKVRPETSLDVDDGAVAANRVSVTPLHYDLTKYEAIDELKSWPLSP